MTELKTGEILGFIWGLRNSRQKEHWYAGVPGSRSMSEELQEGLCSKKTGELRDRQCGVL